jgi:signal transduction histidine kinase
MDPPPGGGSSSPTARPSAPALPRRLFARLLLAALGPTLLALAGFGFFAHDAARRTLEEEMGRRLGAAAAGTALQVLPEQIQTLGAAEDAPLTLTRVQRTLEQAREQLDVRRVALVAADLTGRGDTDGRIALRARAHEFSADAVELARAAAEGTAASPLFVGYDGRPYKRAYARVGPPGAPAGFVVVEASADYLQSLSRFRRWFVAAGGLGLGFCALFIILLARHLTRPLARLAAAAERIGRGELSAPVPVETRDEVGLLAARLDDMRSALRARDERLQMMLAGIAHEVRNPLGGLKLYAGLLRESLAQAPERLAEVGRIEREITYLEHVVTDFLEYARRPRPELLPLPLRPLLEEVAEVAVQGQVGAAGHPALAIEAGGDLLALADRGQLRRAFINLVRNALTAAGPRGRVVLAARVEAGPGGRHIECEVRDSGAGVPEALREKIFEPFFTTGEKGTGLGLAFVREIVRDHGGEVRVDGAPEGGARFRFRLPAA